MLSLLDSDTAAGITLRDHLDVLDAVDVTDGLAWVVELDRDNDEEDMGSTGSRHFPLGIGCECPQRATVHELAGAVGSHDVAPFEPSSTVLSPCIGGVYGALHHRYGGRADSRRYVLHLCQMGGGVSEL